MMFCMPCLVAGGVVGESHVCGPRQRNIFPLPEIPESPKSEAHFDGWERLANQGIKALNELSGCVNSDFSKKKPTRAQKRVLSNIAEAYREASCAVDIDPGASCLADLCSASKIYQTDRSDVVSYAKDSVSWPEVETFPVDLRDCLPPADREWLATWQQHMLLSTSGKDLGSKIKQPYTDPIFKHNPKQYLGFLKELKNRNMLRFKQHDGSPADLGVFFVRKKNNKQRLIFDIRILNEKFIDPPKTDLPSADAFTRMDIDGIGPFFIGSGDLANAFYTLAVPDSLARMFTLPGIKAENLGIYEVDGNAVRRDEFITPYLTVLPMGWSWALHLCQQVMNHAIITSGIDHLQIISDKGKPVHLAHGCDVGCAGYVDNFAVIGTCEDTVNAGLRKIGERLRGFGLTVHEECEAAHEGEFVGLSFNGVKGKVSIKPSRIVKLQRSIDELLCRNFASGELLQLVIGHITWAVMARREALSILSACYSFVHQCGNTPHRLWPRVRTELRWISALLPMFQSTISTGWSQDIFASDSSPYGYGICHRTVSDSTARVIGSQCERWRFRFEDAVDARKHAGKIVGAELEAGKLPDLHTVHDFSQKLDFNRRDFHEVPLEVLKPESWSVVWSHPWAHEDNILHTEALALVWAVEHALRSNRNLNKRLLFLCDNLLLALSASKGRGKSGHLLQPLRKICALSLACGSKVNVRWIPSEWNCADRPSRALTQWASRGLDSWFQSDGSRKQKGGESGEGREKFEKASASGTVNNSSSGNDLPGEPKCPATDNSRLHPAVSRISDLVPPPGFDPIDGSGDGRHVGRLSADPLRRGPRDQRWDPGGGSHEVLSPRVQECSKGGQSFEGMADCCPPSPKNANPTGSAMCHHWRHDQHESERDGLPSFLSIHHLPEARRVQFPESEKGGPSSSGHQSGLQILGRVVAPNGRSGRRKDRGVRCFDHPRQRPLDHNTTGAIARGETARDEALDSQPCRTQTDLQPVHRPARDSKPGSFAVLSAARGGVTRCPVTPKIPSGGEAARPLVQRCLVEEVCEGGSFAKRAEQSPQACERGRSSCPTFTSKPSEKPYMNHQHEWNSKLTKRMESKVPRSKPFRSLTGADLLKRYFRDARRKASHKHYGVFLDLFCGDGGVGHYLHKHGFPVISIDILNDPRLDLTDSRVLQVINGWIRSGRVFGIWFGTPCTTWSRARHGPVVSSWDPLRDNQHIYGIPGLSSHDQHKIRVGNRTMTCTARLIRLCCRFKVPCFLENPSGSMMWLAPPILRLCHHSESRCCVCDFCQYGARWRKRTRIQTWNAPELPSLNHTCHGHKGICSRTHKHHIVLKGQDPVSKQLWTQIAQPYPKQFAVEAAKALIHSRECQNNFQLKRFFGI